MHKTEILVIEDEAQIRKLLQINLESNGYQVKQAPTGEEGIITAANHPPELIILDLGLPDKNGHQVLEELREWYNKPIIILSVLDKEDDIVKALDNGATDYLTKPFRTKELLARIRAALRLAPNENNSVFMQGNLKVDFQKRLVYKNETIIKLTATEYKLISLFVKNCDKVLTHSYILKEIWGYSYVEETQYLRVFVAALRKKIEKNPNNPEHIITESGVGYRFQ
ncbi:response regulator transcription factor [Mesonia maritima]|uniref:Two-component system KDP operon response regulator KdpE n=2 Tax=Mesonia maritima TaxID=1793873 RepID=A0ABU1K8A5_9FLAO|nr:response regulator transcription factor [Mesonia maritima]MDR6301536.1 two-component system KDP operon response regulator KdpE [Mesonia maritima]